MKHKTYWLQSPTGQKLFYQSWHGDQDPKAIICIVHGYAEHSDRYIQMAEVFTGQGFHVYAFDRIGHGQSQGKRGHVDSYDHLLKEVEILIDLAKNEFPETPLFIYGHSQGGNIALNYILRHQPNLSGAIATGSWIYLGDSPSSFMQGLLSILVRLFPRLAVPTGLKPEDISRDEEEVRKYRKDPAIFSKVTLKTAFEMFKASEYLKEKHTSYTPLLLMHGSADKICLPIGSKEFAASFTGNIQYKEWPGRFHEIHNELNREEVFQYTIDWINNQL